MPALTNSRFGSSSSSEADGHARVAGGFEVRDEAASDLCGVHQVLSLLFASVGVRAVLSWSTGRQGWWSIEPEREPLPQLGFLLGHAGAHLVGEQLPADGQAGQPVVQAVGGERLRGAARPDHDVDTGTRAGDEPQRRASRPRRSWTSVRPRRVARSARICRQACFISLRRGLARAAHLAAYLEPDPVARLGATAPGVRRGRRRPP